MSVVVFSDSKPTFIDGGEKMGNLLPCKRDAVQETAARVCAAREAVDLAIAFEKARDNYIDHRSPCPAMCDPSRSMWFCGCCSDPIQNFQWAQQEANRRMIECGAIKRSAFKCLKRLKLILAEVERQVADGGIMEILAESYAMPVDRRSYFLIPVHSNDQRSPIERTLRAALARNGVAIAHIGRGGVMTLLPTAAETLATDGDPPVSSVAETDLLLNNNGSRNHGHPSEHSPMLVVEHSPILVAHGVDSSDGPVDSPRARDDPQEPQGTKPEGETLCLICMDRSPNAMMEPCGHSRFCSSCAERSLVQKTNCPVCRTPVTHVRPHYL